MACSKDSVINKEIQNDSEVGDTLSRNCDDNLPDFKDKPMSPILNIGTANRKFLLGSRLKRNKTRVKLTNRFIENDKQKENSTEISTSNISIPELMEDSFTSSQNECLINRIEKLEEIEKYRQNIYKLMVAGGSREFCFKKPTSPAPNKSKKVKIIDTSENNVETVESESNFEIFSKVGESKRISLSECSGFQTATGKTIQVSDTDIKKHSKLFEDILNPSQNCGTDRSKKYSFLSKSKSNICIKQDTFNVVKPVLSENDESLTVKVLNSVQTELDSDVSTEGFTRYTSSNITESGGFAKRTSGEEQLCNNKFYSGQYIQKFTNRIYSKPEISLTQEICESGISNTQMASAMDDALRVVDPNKNKEDNSGNGFKGFDRKEASESHDFFVRLIGIYQRFEHSTEKQTNRIHHRKNIFSMNDILLNEDARDSEGFKSIELNYKKHVMADLPLPPTKRTKHCEKFKYGPEDNLASTIQNNEVEAQLTNKTNLRGFSNTSGKSVQISKTSTAKARNVFDDIDMNFCHINLLSETNNVGNKDDALKFTKASFLRGFFSASGKAIKISNQSLEKARSIFDNIDFDASKENCVKVDAPNASPELITKSSKLKSLEETGNHFKVAMIDERSKDINDLKESYAATKNLGKVHTSLRGVKNIFDDFDLKFPDTNQLLVNSALRATSGFQTAGGSKLKISEEALKRAEKQFKDIEQEEKVVTPINTSSGSLSTKHSKRRLGVSCCKQIQIPERKLNRAKLLFEEDFCSKVPVTPKSNTTTPIRQNYCSTTSTPIKNDLLQSSKSFSSFIDAAAITPIKSNIIEVKEVDFALTSNSRIVLASPTKGNTSHRIKELKVEQQKLEDRLKVVIERQKVLEKLGEMKLDEDKRPRKGILYQSKCMSSRVSLSSLVINRKPLDADSNYDLFQITPQNAENVHFKEQSFGSLNTEDRAVVIPNSKDTIGLSEIETAFMAMPGVESRLIPSGWLRNHYKWIVWKLASYERMFPLQLSGCLCVENVVQQLKYRYDREIDRAERSALRKIYEKDDAPQKRMIVCVSDIKKVNINKYELELSDGWYGIRTVLDEPLCAQVSHGKIRIGTKLVVCGAELINCDGCYPLECTELTYLKINFNSTRRAAWHAKLGYQRNPGPLSVQIQSVHPLGGLIGAIKICVVRVYPFNFFERLEGYSVWMNKRAEELRAQEWDNERCKKLEQILENVSKDCGTSEETQNPNLEIGCSTISSISCPKTLYEIIKNSKDPDCLQQMLSLSQRGAILDYQSNMSIRKQEEMASKVNENVQKLKLTKRDVVAILKLLVVDAKCDSDKAFNFFIWRPSDSHTQILREGTFFTVQNVLAKKNGDLNSSMKTMFKSEHSDQNLCERFRRRLVQIVELRESTISPIFNEFDTVGVVVQTKIDHSCQEAWLTDNFGRLLLVNIYEGSNTCLLLDNLKRGQAITVCNLKYHGLRDDIVQALANHFTVFSSYSQYRHLQDGLDIFRKELPKDMETFLIDCDSKIELFRIKNSDIKNSFYTTFEDSDEETLVSSRITSTDVALSLIDLDKFN